MGNLSKFCSLAQVLHAQACAGVLTVMWGAVGIDGEGNFNLNLSLPDSGWLRFEVKIYWGLDSHQNASWLGPPPLSTHCGKHDTWMFTGAT